MANDVTYDTDGLGGAMAPGAGRMQKLKHGILVALAMLTVYPVFYMLVTALKSNVQIDTQFWAIFPEPRHWENYLIAWNQIKDYIWNTTFITIVTLFGVLSISSMTAFVFARYQFKGKQFLYYMIIALMMIPGVLTLIPAVIVVRTLGLFNTYWACIIPYIAGGQIFAIFVLRSFFENIPDDYFDAARIDGASEFSCYLRVALPLSGAILGVVAILNVLNSWNDIVWPMIVLSDEQLRTISIGLRYFQQSYRVEQGQMMAGNVIASIPIIMLFMCTAKLFIKGLTTGGLRA